MSAAQYDLTWRCESCGSTHCRAVNVIKGQPVEIPFLACAHCPEWPLMLLDQPQEVAMGKVLPFRPKGAGK